MTLDHVITCDTAKELPAIKSSSTEYKYIAQFYVIRGFESSYLLCARPSSAVGLGELNAPCFYATSPSVLAHILTVVCLLRDKQYHLSELDGSLYQCARNQREESFDTF